MDRSSSGPYFQPEIYNGPLSRRQAKNIFNGVKGVKEEIFCVLEDQRGTCTFVPYELRRHGVPESPFIRAIQESSVVTVGTRGSKER